jgi:tetratricopeptide (TPR) repeat protein
MVRRLVLAAAVVMSAAPTAFAQLDPEPKQPYLWRVVISAKPHPLVTPNFRERLRRDILAALQTGLGPLGTAEVIDLADPELPRDPLVQQFEDKGFAALDAPRDLTGAKTHFLRLEYRDGKFHLQSRQYDGFTGLSSPLVRSESVRAPEQVGRAAGLMLDRDFGLVGTVEPNPAKPDEAKVLLRSSALGPASKHVKAGDVFALAAVRKTNRPAPPPVRTATGKIVAPPPGSTPPPGLTSTPRDFTFLKVGDVAPDGTLRCAVLTRYQNAMPTGGGVVGYRCMKLGTVKAPVAIRLVGSDGTVYKTASAVTVRASDSGFPAPGAADAKDVCNADPRTAQFRSQRALANVACVTVALGPTQAKQFPVPILGAAPITIPFDIDPAKEERAAFERAVLSLASAAADARASQEGCFKEVARLIDKQKNAEALKHAETGYKTADASSKNLGDELARLKEQQDKSPVVAPILGKIEQNLTVLQQYNAQLKGHIDKIAKVVELENDPAKAATQVQAEAVNARIVLLLSGGEVEQALAAYEQLLTLLPDNAEVKARRDKLRAEWKVKDEGHQKARDYLLKTWPAVASIPDFKEGLAPLRSAVDVCKKNGDKWTLRKLLALFSAAGPKLNELAAMLDPSSEADRKLAADAQNAGKVLAALEQEVRGFVGAE